MDSLLALQTEVLRKSQSSPETPRKVSTSLNFKNSNYSAIQLKPQLDTDEEDNLQKSKAILEAKAKFYERMKNSDGIGSDGSKRYLVDFEKKLLDDPEAVKKLKEQSSQNIFEESEKVFAPVHYQHLHENEARELGVGYFEFSLDEETRKVQMEKLKEMHSETKEKQFEKDYSERVRQIALAERLNKIRAKQNLQTSNVDRSLPSRDLSNSELSEKETQNEIKEARAEHGAKALASNREWDSRKRTLGEVIDEKIKRVRDERDPDFAPPSFYESEPCQKTNNISNVPGTGNFVSSLGNAMKSLEEMCDNGPKNIKSGLSLPRSGEIAGLVLGDSVQKRIIAENISDYVFVRGFGGAKAKDISERLSYSTSMKIKHVILTVGLNDALACLSDDVEFKVYFKKCVELIHQKFSPNIIQLGTLTPTKFQLSHVNQYVDRINDVIKCLFNEFQFPATNIQLLDVNAAYQMAISPICPDGIHPSTEGVMVLVQCYRQQFESSGIEINWHDDIKVRPNPMEERRKGHYDT